MLQGTRSGKNKTIISLDPRTQIFMLILINIVMMSNSRDGLVLLFKYSLALIPLVLILSIKEYTKAFLYVGVFTGVHKMPILSHYVSPTGIAGSIIRFFVLMMSHLLPCLVMAYYLLSTTKVSEFIASMERMKLGKKIIIPVTVMFRFFPTFAEEYRSIQDAMTMRKITISKGIIKNLEYRFVPLIVSIVNIGDELSAAAMTRGLGVENKRTNFCSIGFGLWDALFGATVFSLFIGTLIFTEALW